MGGGQSKIVVCTRYLVTISPVSAPDFPACNKIPDSSARKRESTETERLKPGGAAVHGFPLARE
jgi:hypothetical protein